MTLGQNGEIPAQSDAIRWQPATRGVVTPCRRHAPEEVGGRHVISADEDPWRNAPVDAQIIARIEHGIATPTTNRNSGMMRSSAENPFHALCSNCVVIHVEAPKGIHGLDPPRV